LGVSLMFIFLVVALARWVYEYMKSHRLLALNLCNAPHVK
jgi:hypothetical protein